MVFSSGGRILSVSADGGERVVVTSPGPFAQDFGRQGDLKPQISPDGDQMLFTRVIPTGVVSAKRSYMVAARDGSSARRILVGSRKAGFSSPVWMPSGDTLAVERTVRRKRGTLHSVVLTGLDGKVEKTVLRLPLHRTDQFKRDMRTYREVIDIDVSPDAGHMLVTVSDGYRYDRKYLVLVDVATGKKRTVGKNTRHGSFSPDGSSFVYVSSQGNRGETCTETDEKSCVIQGDLWTQDIDGSDRSRITRTQGDEEAPAWSPDGTRIAFEANYNVPDNGLAAEIYTVAPDGSCLSMVTNGAPASLEPQWVPGAGRADALCGLKAPELFTDLAAPVMPEKVSPALRVWPGPQIGRSLISQAGGFSSIQIYAYEDCALILAAECAVAPEITVSALSTCFLGGFLADVVSEYPRSAFVQKRGVTTVRDHSRRFRELTVFTGDAYLSISGRRTEVSNRDLELIFDQLRPVNAGEPPETLPPLHIPKDLHDFLGDLDQLIDHTGSLKKVARRLEVKPKDLRPFVTLSKRLPLFGEVLTKGCTREESDPFGDF